MATGAADREGGEQPLPMAVSVSSSRRVGGLREQDGNFSVGHVDGDDHHEEGAVDVKVGWW